MYTTSQKTSPCKALASSRLIQKLWMFRESDCLLAATTALSDEITVALGAALRVPYYRLFCKPLTHPAHPTHTIGSVTSREVILHYDCASLPQGYVEHQVALMRHGLRKEDHAQRPATVDKTVILIREVLEASDQVSAAVEELRKAGACTVILATPLVNHKAIQSLQDLADELIYGAIDHRGIPVHRQNQRPRISYASAPAEQFQF